MFSSSENFKRLTDVLTTDEYYQGAVKLEKALQENADKARDMALPKRIIKETERLMAEP
jgi:hypothetical protein